MLKSPRSPAGIMGFSSFSTATGSVASVMPRRRERRPTWVSTGRPGRSKATLRTTLAVLRPTPGRAVNSRMEAGTSPPWWRTSRSAMPMRLRALAWKKPVEWMISSSSVGLQAARSSGAR